MLSRKEFFKDLLCRGVRTLTEINGEVANGSARPDPPAREFNLPETELSPALLAMEAELRGIDVAGEVTEELRREICRQLNRTRPDPSSDVMR